LENALIDEVITHLEGDIPECMFTNKVDDMVKEFEYRLSSQGMQLDMYLQYTGMDKEAFRKTFQEQAERQVKIRLALEKIAELEKIEYTPEEIEAEYAKLAESYQMDVEKLKSFIPEQDVGADLKTTRAIDLVRDSAVVTEVELSDDTGEEAAGEEKPKRKPRAKKAAKTEDEA